MTSAQNREKLTPPPCPKNVRIETSKVFCTKKCGRPHLKNQPPFHLSEKCPHLTNSPLTADVFYGQPFMNKFKRRTLSN